MDYKAFLVRTAIAVAGVVGSYVSSTNPEDFAIKTVLWLVIQALISAFAAIKPEDLAKTGARETGLARKFFGKF